MPASLYCSLLEKEIANTLRVLKEIRLYQNLFRHKGSNCNAKNWGCLKVNNVRDSFHFEKYVCVRKNIIG